MRWCSVDGCDNKHVALGFCHRHYHQFRKFGKILPEKEPKLCSVEDCDRRHFAKGLCRSHYYRKKYADKKKKENA